MPTLAGCSNPTAMCASPTYQPPTRDWDMTPIKQRRLDSRGAASRRAISAARRFCSTTAPDLYPDCADVWYLLSLTTRRPRRKLALSRKGAVRAALSRIRLARQGRSRRRAARRIAARYADPAPDEPVEATSKTEACPHCGGALAFDVDDWGAGVRSLRLSARHGSRPAQRAPARGGYDNLDNALLQRRFGFSREWKIGARVLICKNCHAQLTLSSTTLFDAVPVLRQRAHSDPGCGRIVRGAGRAAALQHRPRGGRQSAAPSAARRTPRADRARRDVGRLPAVLVV